MLHLHSLRASVSKMCSKILEKTRRAHKCVMFSVKLDISISVRVNEIKTLKFGSGDQIFSYKSVMISSLL